MICYIHVYTVRTVYVYGGVPVSIGVFLLSGVSLTFCLYLCPSEVGQLCRMKSRTVTVHTCIRESVDSLCRDDADTPMPPYIRKAYNRPNAAFVSLFR